MGIYIKDYRCSMIILVIIVFAAFDNRTYLTY